MREKMSKAQRALLVFQEAVDVADSLIERGYGDDVPSEWNEAFAACAAAIAELEKPAGRAALQKDTTHG